MPEFPPYSFPKVQAALTRHMHRSDFRMTVKEAARATGCSEQTVARTLHEMTVRGHARREQRVPAPVAHPCEKCGGTGQVLRAPGWGQPPYEYDLTPEYEAMLK